MIHDKGVFVRCYPPAESPMASFPFEGWLCDWGTAHVVPAIRFGGAIQLIDSRWEGYSFERIPDPAKAQP